MPYLGDFLGMVMSEMTISRMRADAEAIRLAEIYARDPLLKHFPVPRFRLPSVSMRVPLAVEQTGGPAPTQEVIAAGVVDTKRLKPVFMAVLNEELKERDLTLASAARSRLSRALDAKLKPDSDLNQQAVAVRAVADDLTAVAMEELPSSEDMSNVGLEREAVQASLRHKLEGELIKIRVPPPRLSVIVNASQLREAGDNVVQMDLTIGEQAVEWVVVDQLDAGSSRLVPE